MKRLLGLGAIVFLAGASLPQESEDDFAKKIQGLIEQLRVAATRKKAEAELVKAGSRALPLLRKELTGAEGEFKAKLEGVIRTLEVAERRARAQGKTILVSLSAKDRPLSDVATALQAVTGIPIDLRGEAAEANITCDAASMPLWEALEKICKTHGGLVWDVTDRGVEVRKGKRDSKVIDVSSGYAVLIRDFVRRASEGGRRDTISSNAYVAGPPGVVMIAGHVTFQVLVDDRGTNLMKSPGPTGTASIGGFKILDDPDFARPFYESLRDLQDPSPAKDATKVKVCRGIAYARIVVDAKKGCEIRGTAIRNGAQASAPGLEVKIVSVTITDRAVQMTVDVTDSNIGVKKDRNALYPETGGRLILRDSRGADLGAKVEQDRGSVTMSGPAMTYERETTTFKVEGTLAAETELVSVEVWEPSDVEEIKIPFDLKDIPIVRPK